MKFTRLYNLPLIGSYIKRLAVKTEGGDFLSGSLRRYTKDKYKVLVGMYSHGGCFAPCFNNNARDTITVGRYTSVASDVRCFRADHPVEWASISPYFYEPSLFDGAPKPLDTSPLEIGHDVWIGYGAVITKGCKRIGNGAVIGAGAVVTRDVEPYSIVGGVPARFIKKRFDDEAADALERSKWWELDPKTLQRFFDDIETPRVWAEKITRYRAETEAGKA